MLTYTATDLVELIRRDMEAAAAKPRIHTARSAGLVQINGSACVMLAKTWNRQIG